MKTARLILTNVSRMIVALTFILSGFVKAVDPLGTQYKLHDYLEALSLQGYVADIVLLVVAVALSAIEFTIGVLLFFAIHRRMVTKAALLFMAVMTVVAVWLVAADPVADCGCFGDAVTLTHTQTLWKNIVLLAMTVLLSRYATDMPHFVSRANRWIVKNYTVLFIVCISVWSLYDLPVFDFRPYYAGANIKAGMEYPEGAEQPQFETTFIMEKAGIRREFTVDDYPDSSWTFVDSRTVCVSEGYTPPISDFSVRTREGTDITDELLNDDEYAFWLVSPHLEQADDANFGEINRVYEYADDYGYRFVCLTSSGDDAVERWQDLTGAEYEFMLADDVTLKTMIRSNPGLMLVKNGTVIRKWSGNRLPREEELTQSLDKAAIGVPPSDMIAVRIFKILLWFVLPLALLAIADRLWAWTKWVKRKQELIRARSINRAPQIIRPTLKREKEMRKKIVAGNWKMNMTLQSGVALAKELNEMLTTDKPNCDVVICTPFIHLATIAQILNGDVIGLGAENCADKEKGAYTGEVSAEMVKSTGAQYVILGHSERRGYYGETPEILKEKVLLALKNGLKVIFCIGESLEEREAGKQNEIVKSELEGSVFNLSEEEFKNIIIAYEPIWAIGTGKTATSDQAEEIHAYIRSIIAERYGEATAEATSILYGGSCKASNAGELFAKADIDGGLIGGASLKAADFKGIIDAWK